MSVKLGKAICRATLLAMNKFYPVIAILLLIMFGAAIYDQTRPDPEDLRFEMIGTRAYGNGATDGQTNRAVLKALGDYPAVETLVLKDMPGTTDTLANMRLGRAFRKRGYKTHLESDSYIASGAVELFLSGTSRTLECGARIGVHSWGSPYGYGAQDVRTDRMQALHEGYLSDMGIDPAFYAFTRDAAGPDSIYILTMADIRRFDLLTTYPDCGLED